MTIIGTRPEFIRLCILIKKLDKFCNHILIHTGQNYDYELNEIFFKQLGIRRPNYFLDAKGSFGEQLSIISKKLETIIKTESPDKFLVLGDTNSSLGAIIAKRNGIPVYHMEAGNRCFDNNVPEEVNRRIIDHCSSILLPYTNRSCENLVKEGIDRRRIYITGNPIYEVLQKYKNKINNSKIITSLKLKKNHFFLITLHREENVENKSRLKVFIESFKYLSKAYNCKVVWPIHPRTGSKIKSLNIRFDDKNFNLIKPLGFLDFVNLEKNAMCVLTDSGTVQEECSIFKIPNITLRDTTERPETIESSSNFISSINFQSIVNGVEISINDKKYIKTPIEYLDDNVSSKVMKILLSNYFETPA